MNTIGSLSFSLSPNYISRLSGNPRGRPCSMKAKQKLKEIVSLEAINPNLKELEKVKCQSNLNHDLVKEANKNVDDKFSPASKETLYAVVKAQYQIQLFKNFDCVS